MKISNDGCKIRKTVLPGGICLISEYIPYVRSVTTGVWLNTGSRDEPAGKSGIGHFFEHMVFKGTRNRSARDIAFSLEKAGGHINAFTGKEQICFYTRVPDAYFDVSAEVLSDLMMNPLFSDKDIQTERLVIQEEIRGHYDNADEYVHDLLYQARWRDDKLGNPIAGSVRSVSGLRREDLVRFRRNSFRGGQIVIAAAGRIRHQEMVKSFSDRLNIQCGRRKVRKLIGEERVFSKKVETRDIQQVHFAAGFPGYGFEDDRKYALRVLNSILGEGMSSRLFQRIREKEGLAYSIYSFVDVFEDCGLTSVVCSTDKNRFMYCLKTLSEEIQHLKNHGVEGGELESAKTSLQGGMLMGMESTNNRMIRLARSEIYQGKIEPMEEIAGRIESVSMQKIREVIDDVFSDRSITLALIGPPSIRKKWNNYGKLFI